VAGGWWLIFMMVFLFKFRPLALLVQILLTLRKFGYRGTILERRTTGIPQNNY
jgi:hypothetical protein